MKDTAFIACSLFTLFTIFFGGCKPNTIEQSEFYLGGVQINEADLDTYSALLKKIGMNTVEVTHYTQQTDWDSGELWIDGNKSGVIHEIKMAKKHGLKVVLILRTSLMQSFPRNEFLWHGMIMPKNYALEHWFDRYEYYLSQWASICEDLDVDALVIGSELNALSSTIPIETYPPLYNYFLDTIAQKEL